jgi:predicted acyltransferase
LLLVGYWLACRLLGDVADPYSLHGWFGTAIDRALLGESHLYRGEGLPFDPEGLASTAPAIAQVLLGWWAGDVIARSKPAPELVLRLFVMGTALLLAGYVWQLDFPLNKKIWTSSYVLHSTGLAMLALAVLFNTVELRQQPAKQRIWARFFERFFEIFGRNPLFVFVLSGFIPRVLALLRWQVGSKADGTPLWTSPLPCLYEQVFAVIGQAITNDPRLGSFLFACANLSLYGLLAWWLDRRGVYIRV